MEGLQQGTGVAVVTAGERLGLLQGQGMGRGKPARRGHGVGFLQQVPGIDGERGGAAVLRREAKALAWQKHRIARGKAHPMGVLGEFGVAVVVQKEPVVRMGIDVQQEGGAQPGGDGKGRQGKVTVVMPPAGWLRQGF
jgi:hypothetical protein